MFGRESDVEAARRAGLDSAVVRRDRYTDVELSAELTYEVEDLYETVGIASDD